MEELKDDQSIDEKVFFTVAGQTSDDIEILSKTSISSDGVSVCWEPSDQVCLWATDSNDEPVLSSQKFEVYGRKGSKAFFTSTLSSRMPQGQYEYWCCSPSPLSFNGCEASFEVSSIQDGTGQGIMIATKQSAGPLRPLDEYVETEGLSMRMAQMLHLLQIRVNDKDNLLEGEKITKLQLNFPGNVAGICNADISDPTMSLYLVKDGKSSLTLKPQNAIVQGSAIYACIMPVQWLLGDVMTANIYSETKFAVAKSVNLRGRNMSKAHATPICLTPDRIQNFCHFFISLASNPIGEDVTKITLTAPQSCKWGDTGTNVYVVENTKGIALGTSVDISYEDEALFRAFSGQSISVQYESDHVLMSQNISIPSLDGKYSGTLALNVPHILYEDFHNVDTFSSNDEYKTSKAGSYDPHGFLNGWSGGRIGAQAGKCIRIACRRETSADYDARVDSAPLSCTFKKSTDLKVSFSYGSNNQYGGIPIGADGNVGQNCYVGYITTNNNYKSGDGDGVYDRNVNTFYTKEYTGSYENTPNDADYIIKGIPAGTSPVRISWRTEIEHQAGTTNTTAWLYIDNVNVTIIK